MGRINHILFILSAEILFLLLTVLDLRAQEPAGKGQRDSTATATLSATETPGAGSQDSETVVPQKSKRIDATSYRMQKRFRAADVSEFVSGRFLDNTSVSLIGSGIRLADRSYSSGPSLRVAFGKWFRTIHGARVETGVSYWRDNYNSRHVKEFGIRMSYLFNISSYIWGYDTSRFCDISAVTGPGYSYIWSGGVKRNSFSSHLGLNINLRVFRDFDIFVEPLFELYSGSAVLSYSGTWRRVVSGFNGRVGLSYKIAGKNPSAGILDGDWFVFLTGGPNFQNSSLVYKRVGLSKALGAHIAAGGGKWYSDFFALRMSLFFSNCKWHKYLTSKPLPAWYIGARLEGQLDLVTLLMPKDRNPRVTASILFGPEVGLAIKRDLNMRIRNLYVGLTCAAQAKVRIDKGISVIAEPRFSIVPYIAPSSDKTSVNAYRNYYDALLNFNLGIQYDLPIAR